jgi:hypothetical protein
LDSERTATDRTVSLELIALLLIYTIVLYFYYPIVLYHFDRNYVETGPGPARLEMWPAPRCKYLILQLSIIIERENSAERYFRPLGTGMRV